MVKCVWSWGKVLLALGRAGPQHLALNRPNQPGHYPLALGEGGFCAGLEGGE